MRNLSFLINIVLTFTAIFLVITKYITGEVIEIEILFLLILGFYQIVNSILLTLYFIFNKHKIIIGYLVYWLLVIIYYEFLMEKLFYSCIVLAVLNLYLNYGGISDSKFNIFKK